LFKMMQETEEEDVELVSGGRRGPSSLGFSSDSPILKRSLLTFAFAVIAINVLVFGLGIKYSKDYVAPIPDNGGEPGSQFVYDNFRLPTSVVPTHYQLVVDADMEAFTFTVRENIRIKVSENSTRFLILHGEDLAVSDAHLWNDQGQSVQATSVNYNETNHFVIFDFGDTISRWHVNFTEFNLTFIASGKIGDVARGFYRSSYMENGVRKYLAVTDFEPTDARSAFVCFDEPSFKAKFTISVHANTAEGWHAISNMQEISRENLHFAENGSTNGYEVFHFATSPPMSTYLVCYVVSRFDHVTYSEGSIPVRVFAPPLVKDQGIFAAETAGKIVDYFGEFFGIEYVLPKLDMIALPDFTSGAMENWGLITYRVEALLYDPKVSSLNDKQRIATVISHELAHQWFGNYVTMKWWDNVWLNEGFASFVEYMGVDAIYPDWNLWEQFIPLDRSVAMDLDALESSHPLVVPINVAGEITQQFDSISYSKGASVLRMLREKMENQKAGSFAEGIHFYLNKFNYSNADTGDLWNAIVESTGQNDVITFMESWTQQVGFPYVTVTLSSDNVTLSVEQSRFLLADKGQNSTQLWQVPLTVEQPNSTLSRNFAAKTAQITVNANSWVVLNVNGTGFYRVLYGNELQNRILTQLLLDHSIFSEETRAAFLSDAFALNLAQKVPASYPLSFVEYMRSERNYSPWSITLSAMSAIRPFLDSEAYDTFQEFTRYTLAPVVDELGWYEHANESFPTQLLRPVVLASFIAASDPSDRIPTQGYNIFKNLKNNGLRNVSASLNSAIYLAAARKDMASDYNWIRAAYMNETSATEKNVLLYAMCRFTRPSLVEATLRDLLNPNVIKPKDNANVLTIIARTSSGGRNAAWKFFKDNIVHFKNTFGDAPFVLDSIIRRVTSLFHTESDRSDVNKFFSENELGKGSRSIAQALEQIDINIKWVEKNSENLGEWLEDWQEAHE